MKSTRTILAFLVAVLALPLAAMGQDEPIDDIVVVGKKSLNDMRKDVYKAEEEFYSVYNKLNKEKDFAVRCFYEKATGTRIKNHVCRARFVSQAYSTHAARNRNDLSRVANQDTDSALEAQTAKYEENLETLIAANPELEQALIRYNEARAEFLAEREETSSN
jgi:hypothetical protein